jgi:arylsulfatase A-like enzyme
VLIGAVAFVLAQCRAPAGLPPGGDLSVIWVSLDTLRADHLPLYGYARDTAPFLTELAERGLYFDWAISPQSSTLPSHLTMFSGYHPLVHGVYLSGAQFGSRLAETVPTLPKLLAAAGFRTLARVDGGKMKGTFGFAEGFEVYDDKPSRLPVKLAGVLSDLAELGASERFFYFIHTFQIHAPYVPPPAYRSLFVGERRKPKRQRAVDHYDASIRFVDDELRKFVTALEAAGRLDSTILVVTGDHGESFVEYGIANIGHGGHNLHQNLTRVPWILLHPDARYRGRVDELVGLIDFPNTLLALLGHPERLAGGGVDVFSEPGGRREYVSHTATGAFSLYSGRHHLLSSEEWPGPERNGLFDILADPLEQRPLQQSELEGTLSARLETHLRTLSREGREIGATVRGPMSLDDETRQELRDLGYLQ